MQGQNVAKSDMWRLLQARNKTDDSYQLAYCSTSSNENEPVCGGLHVWPRMDSRYLEIILGISSLSSPKVFETRQAGFI